MNQDIIRMAREAGATPYTNRHYPDRPTHTFMPEQLERFTALVADAEAKRIQDEGMVTVGFMRERIAAEREACAKVVEAIENRCIAKDVDDPPLEHVAAAIRARGQA